MRHFLTIGCAALALVWPGLSDAAIGTTTKSGIGNASTGTTVYVAISAAVPAGALSELCLATGVATSAWAATDTAGNTYTVDSSFTTTYNTTYRLVLLYVPNAVALPAPTTATGSITTTVVTFTTNPGTLVAGQAISGGTTSANTAITGGITQWNGSTAVATVNNTQTVTSATLTVSAAIKATWTTNGASSGLSAYTTGIATSSPLDQTATGTSGTGTSSTVTTGTLGQANELALGCTPTVSGTGTWHSATGFAEVGQEASNPVITMDAGVFASTTAVTYAPSWTTSRAYGSNVATFNGAGVTPTYVCQLSMGLASGC